MQTESAPLERFQAFAAERLHGFEAALEAALPLEAMPAPRLVDAMRYAALGGGKRIRPLLTHAATHLCGGSMEQAQVPAVAVELVHVYSLVHDDLPAMDDDVLRRGRPTCHIAYDEATAILAGDALQARAFELLASHGDYSDRQRVAMVQALSQGAGLAGMVAGQVQDMAAEGRTLTLTELEQIHYLKTGRLITAALKLGGLAAQAPAETLTVLSRYGDLVGLAFQIRDDILDVTQGTEALGKTSGSDQRQGKSTFPSLLGLEQSEARARALCRQAQALLETLPGGDTAPLKALADLIVGRSH